MESFAEIFASLYYGGTRNPVIYYILSYTVILRFKEIIHTLYFTFTFTLYSNNKPMPFPLSKGFILFILSPTSSHSRDLPRSRSLVDLASISESCSQPSGVERGILGLLPYHPSESTTTEAHVMKQLQIYNQ